MKQRIGIWIAAIVLVGASLVVAVQLAAPTRASNADAETFTRANQAYEKGNYQAAANLYQQLIAGGIENEQVYHNLGITYEAMGNPNQAAEMFARARELAPRNVQIAQASSPSIVPMTQNEIALAGLALAGFVALGFVLVGQRLLFKNQANV